MSRVAKRLIILTLGAYLALLASGGNLALAAGSAEAPVTGYAVAAGEVRLEMVLSPPVVAPGELLELILIATNQTPQSTTPHVVIPLPAALELQTGILPAATTYDLSGGTVTWQPFLAAAGSEERLSLRFRAGPAEPGNPVRTFQIFLDPDKGGPPISASYWVGLPPTAAIVINPPQPAVGQPVQLLARTGGSGPLTQLWDTGDHRRLETIDPVIVYPVAGTYEVALHVANPLAATVARATITVSAQPLAAFAPEDATPAVGQPIRFLNQSGGEPPLQYLWDFGDGVTSNEREPVHRFDAAGDYRVSLTLQSPAGMNSFVWPLTVGAPPQASLSLPDAVAAGEPLVAQLYADATVRRVSWDMGDGAVMEGMAVRHSYLAGGDHFVRVIVENDYGATELGQWVTVGAAVERSVFLPLLVQVPLPQPEVGGAPAGPGAAGAAGNVTSISSARPEETFVAVTLEPAPLPDNASEAERLFWYINEARRLHGLPPLDYVHELSVAAQRHAEDMAANQFTGHQGSDGSMPYDRLPRYGYQGVYGGEATAWGFDDPREAVEFWVNSPGHRRIILNRLGVSLGVGFVVDFKAPNVWYWVAEIGQKTPDQP